MSPPAWEAYADAVLQRRGLLCRLGRGVPPRDLAGWFVADAEVDEILRSLPGLGGAPPGSNAELEQSLHEHLARADDALIASLDGDDRFADLVRRAGLTAGQVRTLSVVVAVEVHPQRQRLVGYIQDDVTLPRLTLAGLDGLGLTGGALSAAPTARLITSGMLSVDPEGPWARRAVAASSRLVWYLRGDDSPDPGLPAGTLLEKLAEPPAADQQLSTAGVDVNPVGVRLWLVNGADRRSRQLAAAELTGNRELLVGPVPTEPAQWGALTREAVLRGVPVLLELDEALTPAAAGQLAASDTVRWVLSSREEIAVETLPVLGFHEHRVLDGRPTHDEWLRAIGEPPDGAFRLDREQLRLAAVVAAPGAGISVTDRVRRVAAGHLDRLAQRMTVSRGWDDLVLPVDQRAQLRELVARHRFRGRVYDDWRFAARPSSGLVALFSGPSGTGKTLAAEVIAADLGLDAYKIDLSSVVSKYIGETEKNLGRIFDAAASADLVLFFDEADSLFGKRSEVSDARDRYANIEVSYLLQRLESYDGIVILATNLQRNIDAAFVRRLSLAVEFPLPERPERRRIWQGAFPCEAPTRDVDLDFLADSFKVSGGVIRNAALGAAFMAAADGQVITMEHLALALKREFQKAGRLRTPEEFGRYYDLVTGDGDAEPAR